MLKPPAAILESLGAVLGAVLGLLGGGLGAVGSILGAPGGHRGRVGGRPEGARPVFYEYVCESVLLLEIEEKHEQKRWSDFMS